MCFVWMVGFFARLAGYVNTCNFPRVTRVRYYDYLKDVQIANFAEMVAIYRKSYG